MFLESYDDWLDSGREKAYFSRITHQLAAGMDNFPENR